MNYTDHRLATSDQPPPRLRRASQRPATKNLGQKGFASFEFVWTIPVFAFLFILFSDFFHLFNSSARTMMELHRSAFATMGQVNRTPGTGYSSNSTGLIYRGEHLAAKKCRGKAKCNSTGETYVLSGRKRKYIFFGGNSWYPKMGFHFKLPQN